MDLVAFPLIGLNQSTSLRTFTFYSSSSQAANCDRFYFLYVPFLCSSCWHSDIEHVQVDPSGPFSMSFGYICRSVGKTILGNLYRGELWYFYGEKSVLSVRISLWLFLPTVYELYNLVFDVLICFYFYILKVYFRFGANGHEDDWREGFKHSDHRAALCLLAFCRRSLHESCV